MIDDVRFRDAIQVIEHALGRLAPFCAKKIEHPSTVDRLADVSEPRALPPSISTTSEAGSDTAAESRSEEMPDLLSSGIGRKEPAEGHNAPASLEPSPTQPKLFDRHFEVMMALEKLKATCQTQRRPAKIVAKAAFGVADEFRVKESLAELTRIQFVNSVTGRKGGSWLMPKGQEALAQYRKENNFRTATNS